MPTQVRTEDLLQELTGIKESLRVIVEGLPNRVPTELQVWSVYAGAEKTVAILKYRLKAERPGVFSELPKFRSAVELLPSALEKLTEAGEKMEAGRLLDGLETLRGARDDLRAYLSEERKVRMRVKRRAAASRLSS